jgi:hypothetical protein
MFVNVDPLLVEYMYPVTAGFPPVEALKYTIIVVSRGSTYVITGAVPTVIEFDARDKPLVLFAFIVTGTGVPGVTGMVNGEVVVFAFI